MASETVTIRESRRWVSAYFLGSLALSSLFTPFAYADWKDGITSGTILTAALVLGFWATSGALLYRFVRPLDLLVTDGGFRLRNWRQPTSWADVEGFGITYQRFDIWSRRMIYRDHGPGVRLVSWRLKPSAARPLRLRLGRALSGVDGMLPHTLAIDAADLLALLEERRQGRLTGSPQDPS